MTQGAQGPLIERRTQGSVQVLEVRASEVYQADVIEQLGRQIRLAIDASRAGSFVLDLSRVRFLTSGALGLIINLRSHMAGRGYDFVLAGATGEVAHVVRCTRLAEVMPVYATVDDAVRHLECPDEAGET